MGYYIFHQGQYERDHIFMSYVQNYIKITNDLIQTNVDHGQLLYHALTFLHSTVTLTTLI